jgi:heme/copper-type cytochrome/quinol oxidase subunit 2
LTMNVLMNWWNIYQIYIIAPFIFTTILWFILFGFQKYKNTTDRNGDSKIEDNKRFSYIWWFRNFLLFIQINYLKCCTSRTNNGLDNSPYLPKFHPILIPLTKLANRIIGVHK